jgi:hypothetical protein
MNANELADELEGMTTGWFDDLTLTQSATMLRQQQEKLTKYEYRNIAQCDRIAILEAQLKKAQEK